VRRVRGEEGSAEQLRQKKSRAAEQQRGRTAGALTRTGLSSRCIMAGMDMLGR
jgi:hypothetical protein